MELTGILIKNFRSINEININIENKCVILVGKNEAGKSNILKAIAGGISQDAYKISQKDKRKKGAKETINPKDYYIEYDFTLTDKDIELFEDSFGDIYDGLFKINKIVLTKNDFIKKYFSRGCYKFDITTQIGNSLYYSLPPTLKLNKNIGKIITETSDKEGKVYKVGDIFDIDNADLSESSYNILSKEELIKDFTDYLRNYIKNNLPETILWEYEEKYLIPNQIPLQQFIDTPSNFLPLKNIFNLAGYFDIKTEFKNALEEDGDYQNLFENVSTVATKEFAKKWPDLKKVKFVITKDGDNIIAKVKEKVSYNFEDRSDGFKKFVSILLMLSSRVETDNINNALIIIDEPDRSLYPTGAKYLRDELIKMSKKNIIFYSTHSPFMIDKSNLERHIIVEKDKNDISNIFPVSDTNYKQNEVLLNAIGTSAFEFLKEKNIIFEGWGDYKLFEASLKSLKSEHKEIVSFFRDFGVTYATGVKDIKTITPLFKIANKKIYIFTDSDEAANNAKNSYTKEHGYMCDRWYTFEDLCADKDNTMEDFVTNDLLMKAIKNIDKNINIETRSINQPVMQFLYSKLSKDEKWSFKNYVANNINCKYIKDSYYFVLNKLKSEIGKVENDE